MEIFIEVQLQDHQDPYNIDQGLHLAGIYVKLSKISRNPKENLIYLNISDSSPDETNFQFPVLIKGI